ncbi:Ku protein [Streptomyces sp. NPDC056704]|uniref:Ku protein n=1 Tax=Streptomyces sp. NPDC056704 TaxID=3345917 RepID=UPI003681B2B7
MPRPLWSGAISFGLVTIPVKLMSATEDRSVRFHLHTEDLGRVRVRVRVRKYCEAEDREVSAGEIGKGYEVSKDTLVSVTDEELEQMPLPTAKAIEIVAFVPAASIDPSGTTRSATPPSSPRRRPRSRTPRSTRPCCWSNRDRVRRSEGEVHPPRRVHPRR